MYYAHRLVRSMSKASPLRNLHGDQRKEHMKYALIIIVLALVGCEMRAQLKSEPTAATATTPPSNTEWVLQENGWQVRTFKKHNARCFVANNADTFKPAVAISCYEVRQQE